MEPLLKLSRIRKWKRNPGNGNQSMAIEGLEFRVCGLGSGFRVWGLGFRAWVSGEVEGCLGHCSC